MLPRIPIPHSLDSRPFTTAEGKDAGLGAGRLRGTDLQRPFHGIRVPDGRDLDVPTLALALQAKLPAAAYFSGVTAALVMGVPLPRTLEESTLLHVSVPAPGTPPRGRGVIGHSVTKLPTDVRLWKGIRISTPPRAWCELSNVLTMPDLVAAGDYLVYVRAPLTTVDELHTEIARNPRRRGIRRLREAMKLLDGRAESRRESLLRVMLVKAGLGDVTANFPIRTSGGYGYRGDLVFVKEKVIVEYQSDYHRDPEQFRRDMTRISRLQADGWLVIQVNADDLRNPTELVARIRRVLTSR